jgi:hypothetical protein
VVGGVGARTSHSTAGKHRERVSRSAGAVARLCDEARSRQGVFEVTLRQGAAYAARTVLQDVGVDHGRGDAMAEELLDGADVVATLQQVRREGVAEGVAGHTLLKTGLAGRTSFTPPLGGGLHSYTRGNADASS